MSESKENKNKAGEKTGLKPADLVRTEAAALEALATRLDGPMAEPFERAVELILRCGKATAGWW